MAGLPAASGPALPLASDATDPASVHVAQDIRQFTPPAQRSASPDALFLAPEVTATSVIAPPLPERAADVLQPSLLASAVPAAPPVASWNHSQPDPELLALLSSEDDSSGEVDPLSDSDTPDGKRTNDEADMILLQKLQAEEWEKDIFAESNTVRYPKENKLASSGKKHGEDLPIEKPPKPRPAQPEAFLLHYNQQSADHEAQEFIANQSAVLASLPPPASPGHYSAASWAGLSRDLFLHIFEFVGMKAFRALCLTCKRWKMILEEPHLWLRRFVYGTGRFRLRKLFTLLNNNAVRIDRAAGYFVADGIIPANEKAVARLLWTFREYVRDQTRLQAYLSEERNERILQHYLRIESKTDF